MAPSGVYKRWS